ncbi:hypothetical protein N6H14_26680 [Paenibacillus sp. CC-CFT747]|nr:hypothetical protein N6H14_26680 [Paenibacillus sp. CC-CFT747]
MGNHSIVEHARSYLYKNGRLLDRRRYEYFFEAGSKEAVIDALRAYQNQDGGFGNALEPDIRCPYSQPVPTELALLIMDEMDGFDPGILDGIVGYLRDITLPGGGLPLVFRNVSDFAHAPWWSTDQDHLPSINPTGRIIGLLCKQVVRPTIFKEEWFLKNVTYLWRVFEQDKPKGFHDGIQWITFLQHVHDKEKANAYWPMIEEWLKRPGTIEKDPHAEGYVHKILDWAPVRDSYVYPFLSDDEIEIHLRALVEQQQEDGGWPITWLPVSPGGETDWRGWLTVERLKTLKSYGVV